ncbi:hypothetical protein QL093DRAFT_2527422 [Fusarium oxysporum]|nr:hypothetical protein FOWG_17500 [Fusarium oxysporum f. sp. lycopersici MN25]KAJ9413068.1 hypothetical protein QL093DRAFT_2527422 [Fusarium oxysporum]
MNDLHHSRFIEDWFDGIIPNPELTKPNNRLPQPRAVVTKRRHSMTTPPPSNSGSHNQRASSPTKRQRLDYTNGYGSDTGDVPEGARVEEMEMGEETPRSNINQARPHLPPIPFRGFDVPGITPSRSNSMASGSSCQSPSVAGSEKSSARGRRKRSPVKSANGLWVLDLPVVSVRMGDNPAQVLPTDVKDLFTSIDDIVEDHIRVFPLEIREDVEAIIPRAKKKNDWFRPAQVASQQSATEDETSFPRSRKPKSALEVALHELDFLRDIVNTAQDCKDYTRAEVSWNIQVHQPLLQHSLAGHATVQVEPSLTARILSPFSAATSGRGGGNVIENKMIDFCLTLWLNDGKPHRLLDERNAKAVAADLKLISAIADKVWSQPPDAQSVNQTGYPPLQFAPIACNIETKTSSVQQDGELQLSVWTAAWYQRMNMLVPERIAQHGIITLPLLYIIGHDWKLSFACWRGNTIEIMGPLALGDTTTLLGTYTIVAVLRKIGDWITTVYRDWIEKMFLQEWR